MVYKVTITALLMTLIFLQSTGSYVDQTNSYSNYYEGMQVKQTGLLGVGLIKMPERPQTEAFKAHDEYMKQKSDEYDKLHPSCKKTLSLIIWIT